MSKTIKYTGTQSRWPELAATGKQSVWYPGQTEERSDTEANQLLATGQFTEVFALDDLNLPSLVSGAGTRIVGADKIRAMTSAIARAGFERRVIGWHGHSIVLGQSSNDTATSTFTDAQAWRISSLSAQVGRLLNASGGGALGAGVETMAPISRGYFTAGGATTFTSPGSLAGPGGYVAALSASTDTLSFAAQGASVRVYCYASASGVVARYNINGGSTVNVAAAPATPTGYTTLVWYEFTISGLTAGDTVQLQGATSGNYRVYAVDLAYSTAAGLTLHRLAVSGFMGAQTVGGYLDDTDTQPASYTWTGSGTPTTARTMQTDSLTTRLGLAGVINMFDVNDIKAFNDSSNGTAWGWTLDTLRRHLTNYLAAMASRSLPVLLVLGPYRDPAAAGTVGTPYTQQDIIDAYKAIAAASTNCAYIDLTAEWTAASLADRYAQQQASGLIYDTVHPGSVGAGYYAQRVAQALLAA